MFGHSGQGLAGARLVRRPRQQLELTHAARALPMRGAEAVGAGVAAADDDDVLVLRGDERLVGDIVAFAAAVLQRRYSIAKWMPVSSRPGTWQIARRRRAAGEHDRVELARAARRRGTLTPTLALVRNVDAFVLASASSRRSRTRFSILNSGMP